MTTTTPNDTSPASFRDAPEWVRLKAAAHIAGDISVRTIQRWIALGYVHAVKPAGGLVLVSLDSLCGFIEGSERARYARRVQYSCPGNM